MYNNHFWGKPSVIFKTSQTLRTIAVNLVADSFGPQAV